MKGPDIRIKGVNLLPASAFNLLEAMKVLLNGKTGRHALKNLLSSGRNIAANRGSPSVVSFPNDQDKNLTTRGPIGGPEDFKVFGFLAALKRCRYRKPLSTIRRLIRRQT